MSTVSPHLKYSPVLEVSDLTKIFNGRTVLDHVSLSLEKNETLCIIGPSGSGKSTLLRCITRLEAPDAGSTIIDGVDVPYGGRSLDEVRKRVGFVFQQFNLFPHMTAISNIMCALMHAKGLRRKEAREVAFEELETVGLSQMALKYPRQLSGGEQQRVAIARAIAMHPVVVLFDEPTSALDPELVGEVLEAMERLSNRGTAMLVVTHEMKFARSSADRVLFMDHGRVIEAGKAEDIFDNPRTPRLQKFLSHVN